jgi:hypothetical protein
MVWEGYGLVYPGRRPGDPRMSDCRSIGNNGLHQEFGVGQGCISVALQFDSRKAVFCPLDIAYWLDEASWNN